MHQPDEEDELQEEVEGDQAKDERSKLIDDLEGSVNNPVSEPLFIILNTAGFESTKAHKGGVKDADNSGNINLTNAKHNKSYSAVHGVVYDLSLVQTSRAFDLRNHLVELLHFLLFVL